ncbi:MAG: aminotransferase class I/II-fold pyridoxal phosphate-dependent enzyme [Clostridiales bacterium]|nr:aminotransferase class I/II-fold pyridoxal phosphate-dependent enzyme [Clostridiales bacterium]
MRDLVARRFAHAQDSAMAAAAAEKRSYPDLIDLSIGDTDFTTDERITRAAMADALAGHTHYTDPQGDPELIEEVRRFYDRAYRMPVDRSEVFVTASSCFGMALSLMAILNPGDEVLLFAPYFPPYREQAELAGGVCVEVPTFEEDGFAIDAARLDAAITPRTRAMIVNNPCNPTGAAYDARVYGIISRAARAHDLIVLADEIYTDYMFAAPFAPLRQVPGMAERTVTLNSFSKNYIMTGWRIGYVVAPPPLVNAMRRINENLVYTAPSISQRAAIHALRLRDEIGDRYTAAYRERVFYCARRINAIPGLSVRRPEGTFYLFINIRRTGLSSMDFCRKVLREAHVAMVPGVGFGQAGEGYARIACTTSLENLREAFDRIERLAF